MQPNEPLPVQPQPTDPTPPTTPPTPPTQPPTQPTPTIPPASEATPSASQDQAPQPSWQPPVASDISPEPAAPVQPEVPPEQSFQTVSPQPSPAEPASAENPVAQPDAPQQPTVFGVAPVAPGPAAPHKPFPTKLVIIIVAALLGLTALIIGVTYAIQAATTGGTGSSVLSPAKFNELTLETQTSTQNGFSIDVPAGWSVRDNEGSFSAVESVDDAEAAGASNLANLSILYTDYTKYETLSTEEADYFKQAKSTVQQLTESNSSTTWTLVSEEDTTIGENKAYVAEYSITSKTSDTKSTAFTAYIYVNNKEQYTLHYEVSADDAPALEAVDKIIQSFKSL